MGEIGQNEVGTVYLQASQPWCWRRTTYTIHTTLRQMMVATGAENTTLICHCKHLIGVGAQLQHLALLWE